MMYDVWCIYALPVEVIAKCEALLSRHVAAYTAGAVIAIQGLGIAQLETMGSVGIGARSRWC